MFRFTGRSAFVSHCVGHLLKLMRRHIVVALPGGELRMEKHCTEIFDGNDIGM